MVVFIFIIIIVAFGIWHYKNNGSLDGDWEMATSYHESDFSGTIYQNQETHISSSLQNLS